MVNAAEEIKWRRDIEQISNRIDCLELQNSEELAASSAEISLLRARAAARDGVGDFAQLEIDQVPSGTSASQLPPPLPQAIPAPEPTSFRPPALPKLIETTADSGTFEMQLGRVWLVRFGIILLLTGLVLLGNFAYKNWIREMPNGLRLAALFAIALILIEAGRRLTFKPALERFGEVVLAGGLAFFYY